MAVVEATLYNQRCDINALDQLFSTLRVILERCKNAVADAAIAVVVTAYSNPTPVVEFPLLG